MLPLHFITQFLPLASGGEKPPKKTQHKAENNTCFLILEVQKSFEEAISG